MAPERPKPDTAVCTVSSCYNSGGAGDELYVEIKFTKPMTFKGMASSVDKKTFMPYFLPE